MNTFYRMCIVICIGLIFFNLLLVYFADNGYYGLAGSGGKQIGDASTVLGDVTDLSGSEANMNYLWGLVLGGVIIGGAIGAITHSIVPVGISVFGTVFWASFIRTHGILSYGGYIPAEFLAIFYIGAIFIFVAAIVGMLTGSG